MPPVEINLRRRDQRPLTILATYSMITLEDGRRIQVSAVADVTARKAQAAELQQRMQEAEREAAEKTRLLAELDQKLDVIARQHQQILDLSAPILDIWDGVLLLPLIGRLDGRRVSTITEVLLQAVVARRARNVILDMTSLELLDTANLGYIGTMVQALRLLGVRSIITGIRPAAAQTMVRMGVDLQGVMTVRDLQQGLRACIDPALRSPRST